MSASMLNIEERSMKKQNLLAALTAAVVILNGTGTATAQQTPQYQVGGIISPLTITDGPVKPGRGEKNEQTNDTGGNRICPAKLMAWSRTDELALCNVCQREVYR